MARAASPGEPVALDGAPPFRGPGARRRAGDRGGVPEPGARVDAPPAARPGVDPGRLPRRELELRPDQRLRVLRALARGALRRHRAPTRPARVELDDHPRRSVAGAAPELAHPGRPARGGAPRHVARGDRARAHELRGDAARVEWRRALANQVPGSRRRRPLRRRDLPAEPGAPGLMDPHDPVPLRVGGPPRGRGARHRLPGPPTSQSGLELRSAQPDPELGVARRVGCLSARDCRTRRRHPRDRGEQLRAPSSPSSWGSWRSRRRCCRASSSSGPGSS